MLVDEGKDQGEPQAIREASFPMSLASNHPPAAQKRRFRTAIPPIAPRQASAELEVDSLFDHERVVLES